MVEAVAKSLESFGPIAFGVLALLTVWRFIVAPELARSRGDAKAILLAAQILERVTNKLERMAAGEKGALDVGGNDQRD